MDQRKEAVFRYIDEHRQEILEDWKALVNHEGSLRQPDAMHAEAEYLCGRFRSATAARHWWTESRWACTAPRKRNTMRWTLPVRTSAAGWNGTRTRKAGTVPATALALITAAIT